MSASDPHHQVGHTIDRADQVSSFVLLGFAVIGSLATVLINTLLI